jgi:imidazolonepropionase-like amidohydrolase
LVAAGVDFIKVMGTGGGMTPGSNPGMPQYTVEELRTVVEEAHRLGRHVTVHVHATEGIRRAVEAGVDMLEHCSWLRRTYGDDYDPEIVARIIAEGICVSLHRRTSEGS